MNAPLKHPMTQKLHISDTVDLPADIGTETIAILGRRGSGKSNTGTALIEELIAAGQQVVLLDPKGEGWGLKAQGTGGAGLDVIVFGEPEGDLPLREEHAETIADFVVSSGRSSVLSLAGFDSDAAARRFVARFAERLFTLKKKPENRSPLMVVLEESHLFVPQRVEGAQAEVVSRLQRLVRQGRSMGLGVMLIDQRPASVNKDVLTQIELMICHQLTSPHDRKAVDAWIEANAEVEQAAEFRKTLVSLQPGEAWIWSPAKLKVFERAKIRRRNTFDSGATPILGKDAAKRPKMREVDLEGLRTQLDRVVEEKKANDPAELKKKLAAAEKALTAAQQAKPAAAAPAKIVEKAVITDNQIARLEQLQDRAAARVEAWWKRAADGINPLLDLLNGQRGEIVQLRQAIAAVVSQSASLPHHGRTAPARPISPPDPKKLTPLHDRDGVGTPSTHGGRANEKYTTSPGTPGDTGDLSRPQKRILDAIAWWNSIGVTAPSRSQVGFVAGIKPTGGHFTNTIGPLSTRGLIEYTGDGVRLTSAGADVADVPETQTTLASYHAMIRQLLKKGPTQRIFDVIVARRGEEIAIPEIGEKAGIDAGGGHFTNSIGPLGTLGLIERRNGVAFPTALLFPGGLS